MKYKRNQDLQNALFSHLLAKYLIYILYGVEFNNIKFKYNNYGKPLVDSNEEIYFNISHCDNYVICALDDNSIGVDIERVADIDLKIADRFFTSKERDFINSSKINKLDRFYQIWTMKESYIKAIGMGLTMPLNKFSVIDETNSILYNSQKYYFYKCNIAEYYKLAICSSKVIVNANIYYLEDNKFINELLKLRRTELKKVLEGIVPYNDFYYSYCLYNSLFSAINYHKIDILPIMINGIPEYFYDKETMKFGVIYKDIIEQEIVMNKTGLKSIYLDESVEFNEFIKQSIDDDGPVIINIDWFYMSNQKQTYNKTHRMHTILVVGYDEDKEIYNIFDQKFVDTLTYDICEISFKALKEAYNGYLDLHKKKYSCGVVSIQKNDNQKNDNQKNDYDNLNIIKKLYIENILNKEYWKKRIFIIKDYINNINELLDDTSFITVKFNSVLAGLNDIINQKNVEKYVYSTLFENDFDNISIIVKIIKTWSLIRSKLLKCSFEGIVVEKDKTKIIELLNDIKNLEERFCDTLSC